MNEKPNRPPDLSALIQLPSDETLVDLGKISTSHADPAVRLLAAVVARLCPSVEAIATALPGIASGAFVSLEPDIEDEGTKS